MTAIEFRAPWSTSLRFMTVTTVIVIALIAALVLIALASQSQVDSPAAFAMLTLPLLLLAAALASRVRGYTLTEHEIVVRRGLGDIRLPLAGLRSVTGDAEAMRGSLQLGNFGLFAISGRFWSRQLGWYRVFATDPSRAVVLRFPKHTIVITPHDPQHFIMRARTFLKVADFPK